MLKIAFVLDDGMDRQAGVQQYILMLGRWYVSQGHEVHYLVGETKNRSIVPNLHVMSRNLHTQFNGNRVSTPLPASRQKIKLLLEREKFDVVHVQMPYSPFMAATVIKSVPKETPVIGTFHIMPFARWQLWTNYGLALMLKPTLGRFDKIFAVSTAARTFAKQVYGIDASILPNPVEYDAYRHGATKQRSPDDFVRLLFIGRLVKRKGCTHLLKALAVARKQGLINDSWRLDVLSDGPDRRALEQYARSHKIKQNVNFLGYVTETEKIAYLQQADIAVFPSLGGESFGIVLTEALAANSPIVLAGDNPGYRSVLEDYPESLFDPKNTTHFAELLAKYINSPSSRDELFARQQKIGDKYDVRRVGKALLETYRDCKNADK